MLNKTILYYKILKKLGEGGNGVVYKAEDLRLNRIVALKFLHHTISYDEDSKRRFINEAQSASAIDHPNICTIHEIGSADNDQMYISMSYYEGETLKEKIKKGSLSREKILDITLQICAGLNKAHKNGVIHRDIKPANIFITNEGIVKILDFGLAKAIGKSHLTLEGSTLGTVAYMSPEQARGEDSDQRTDIWSLGVVIYEMLTGAPPFNADYDQAIIYSILNSKPNIDKLPREFVPMVKKAMAKILKDRYQNIEEVLTDLKLFGKDLSVSHFFSFPFSLRYSIRFNTKSIISIVLILIIGGILFLNINKKANKKTIVNERKMIVVLPFENLGPPKEEYFSEGVRSEISNKLASFASLGVISRNSAEKYARSNKTIKEIGKDLGVNYILEGTIQLMTNKEEVKRIRIIAELIRVRDDIILWSDSYEEKLDDIFNIQNRIARNVIEKLNLKIIPGQFTMGAPPTKNFEAYDYYLKALMFQYRNATRTDLITSISLFEKAVEIDPEFAEAYANLSIIYGGMYTLSMDRNSSLPIKAHEYLKKSVALKPDNALVHLAEACYYMWVENDLRHALNEFNNTVEIQPSNAEAYFWIGAIYGRFGNYDLALKNRIKASLLDPLIARYPWTIGDLYNMMRDYRSAEKYYKLTIELGSNVDTYFLPLALNYIDWNGDTKLARQVIEGVDSDQYLEDYFNIFIYLDILDRKYKKALSKLKSSKMDYENNYRGYIPNLQMIALVYRYMQQFELSKIYFDSSRIYIEKMFNTNISKELLHRSLSITYAGLNEEQKAIEESRKALKLTLFVGYETLPEYIYSVDELTIYTLCGDYKNALAKIDFLLSNPSGFSLNRLKLDPLFDPLRNLPGYKRIIDKYEVEN
ncbi:MAG: protein kinase [Bacteroidetes bacterium]|nr:protein kinase [Bacteroidota bacterium]